MSSNMSQVGVTDAESVCVRLHSLGAVSRPGDYKLSDFLLRQYVGFQITDVNSFMRQLLTIVPDAHTVVVSLLWQLIFCEFMRPPCDIGARRVGFADRYFGLLILVYICKTFAETAGYCSPSVRCKPNILVTIRHVSGVI
jgi:hypothetical protein